MTDGRLAIDFVYQVEFPCIAAIVDRRARWPRGRSTAAARPTRTTRPIWPAVGRGGKPRYLPADDFYADWAAAEFGPEAAEPIAAIFAKIDGHLPRPADWVDGPGRHPARRAAVGRR